MIDPGAEWIKDEARRPKEYAIEQRPNVVFFVSEATYLWAVQSVNVGDQTNQYGVTPKGAHHARWILDHIANGTAVIDDPCFPGRVVIGEETA